LCINRIKKCYVRGLKIFKLPGQAEKDLPRNYILLIKIKDREGKI